MALLNIEWGIDGLKRAVARKDNIVIIDQLRFSSTIVIATALGFVIEPTSDKSRRTESFTLSPLTFFDKKPGRVVVASSNGAFLSINAKDGKRVVYGSILNAKAVGDWINKINGNTTLLAAGEIGGRDRHPKGKELEMLRNNPIFCIEDFMAAGAIARSSNIKKTDECVAAENFFDSVKDKLIEVLKGTASHEYNAAKGNGGDTEYTAKLNQYNVVPILHFVDGIPEIKPPKQATEKAHRIS